VFLAQPKAQRIKYAGKHRVVETNMLKLQEFFEGCRDADVCSGEYARLMDGKKRQRKTPRLRTLVAVTGTGTLTDVTAKTVTDMVIGLMRGTVKTITLTIAIHHAKIKRTATVIKMTSLIVLMTKDTPRLQNLLRTVKVATMPTMWRLMTTLLTIVPALISLIPPSRKSNGFACDHLCKIPLKAPLRVTPKRITTFSQETPP
jgi:hypothetical protein